MATFGETMYGPGFKIPWLDAFMAASRKVSVDLVRDFFIGAVDLGHLQAAEGHQLLVDWVEFEEQQESMAGFNSKLGLAISNFINEYWGKPLRPEATERICSLAWQALCVVLRQKSHIFPVAIRILQIHVTRDRFFLESLSTSRATDPAGYAWLAIASGEDKHRFLADYFRMCQLWPDSEPWWRGAIGLRCLRQSNSGYRETALGAIMFSHALRRRLAKGEFSISDSEEEAHAEFVYAEFSRELSSLLYSCVEAMQIVLIERINTAAINGMRVDGEWFDRFMDENPQFQKHLT